MSVWTRDGQTIRSARYAQNNFLKEDQDKVADCFGRWLKDTGEQVGALAVRGFSGTIMGSILSNKFDIPLIIVRKPEIDNTHSIYKVEGSCNDRILIIDDFTSSGATLNRIIDAIDYDMGKKTFIGAFLYRNRYPTHGTYIDGEPPVFDVEHFGSGANWQEIKLWRPAIGFREFTE